MTSDTTFLGTWTSCGDVSLPQNEASANIPRPQPMNIDTDALATWLADHLGLAAPPTITNPHRPTAGQSNDTWLFTAERPGSGSEGTEVSAKLVLRLQPTGQQIFLAADVAREGRVLAGLAGSGVPAPRVIGIEATGAVLGRPFFVMEQVAGQVPLARPSIHTVGWLPTLSPTELRALWDSALDTLVAVHQVDWQHTHRFLLDGLSTDGLLARHVDRLAEWYRWTTNGRSYPITDAALAQIIERRGIGLPRRTGAGVGGRPGWQHDFRARSAGCRGDRLGGGDHWQPGDGPGPLVVLR